MNWLQESRDTHGHDDTLQCHEATRDKINFMYLIIQCKNISCNKFSFFKKKRKHFDGEKRWIYGIMVTINIFAKIFHVVRLIKIFSIY